MFVPLLAWLNKRQTVSFVIWGLFLSFSPLGPIGVFLADDLSLSSLVVLN